MDALSSIVDLQQFSIKNMARGPALSNLFQAYDHILRLPDSEVKNTLLDTVSSWIEVTIISDVELMRVLEYWDMLSPRADSIVKGRLAVLCGVEPSTGLVEYIVKCLRGTAAQRGRGRSEQHQFYDPIFSDMREKTGADLRCNCCGYHFREKDLNDGQKRVARRLELSLARTLHPGRNEDPLKPVQTKSKVQEPLTKLTIDHVTPELRLGWTYPDNLECLCTFCNQAKLAYRRPLEPVSVFCAGALSNLSKESAAIGVRSTILVSIIRANGHACHLCQRDWSRVELTVFRDMEDTVAFSPLAMRSICYDCFLTRQ